MFSAKLKISPASKKTLRLGLSNLQTSLLAAGSGMTQEIGKIYEVRVRKLMGVFESGGPHNWEPLSPMWIAAKLNAGYASGIWEATGAARDAVHVDPPTVVKGRVSSFAGVSGESMGSGATAIDHVLVAEFGGQGPARPLFGPEALRVVAEINEAKSGNFQSAVAQVVRRAFKKAVAEAHRG